MKARCRECNVAWTWRRQTVTVKAVRCGYCGAPVRAVRSLDGAEQVCAVGTFEQAEDGVRPVSWIVERS